MKEYLIVDGYNIIGAWPELAKLRDEEDMAYARDKLIEELNVHAALSGVIITVISDAYLVKGGGGANETVGNVQVIFTKEGITADMAIERLTAKLPKHVKVTVATSDRLQQETVWSKGALRISAQELKREIKMTEKSHKKAFQKQKYSANRLADVLDAEIWERLDAIHKTDK